MSSTSSPRRGELWLVNLDPTVGSEIQKTRPAVVISSDAVGRLPIKLVAPITDWKDHYTRNIWHVRIDLERLIGKERMAELDLFDRDQLAAVITVCRRSHTLSEAGRALFHTSRDRKKTVNDADRLRKYLARFGLDWRDLRDQGSLT